MNLELLAPAGDMEKLKTALHFGADAVYFAGTKLGLRAFAGNFTMQEIPEAVALCHSLGKKAYVTVNVFAYNDDFDVLPEYLAYLKHSGVDGVIVSDPGVISLARRDYPDLDVHVSTQANLTNAYAVRFWAEHGVKRVVLAREMSLKEIAKTHEILGDSVELEAFCHGAMCISYSGRCLLSNYLMGRDANRGECVQACRWEYVFHEKKRANLPLTMSEDERGTYVMNSKDLCMIRHLKQMADAGITSFKIEGRMKTPYYLATVVNAYRRAFDAMSSGREVDMYPELLKAGHRGYTTGFFYKETDRDNVCLDTPQATQTHDFVARVLKRDDSRGVLVEQRNRFLRGDELEILSPSDQFNQKIIVGEMTDEDGRQSTMQNWFSRSCGLRRMPHFAKATF